MHNIRNNWNYFVIFDFQWDPLNTPPQQRGVFVEPFAP